MHIFKGALWDTCLLVLLHIADASDFGVGFGLAIDHG